jgi:hypothetical protein
MLSRTPNNPSPGFKERLLQRCIADAGKAPYQFRHRPRNLDSPVMEIKTFSEVFVFMTDRIGRVICDAIDDVCPARIGDAACLLATIQSRA